MTTDFAYNTESNDKEALLAQQPVIDTEISRLGENGRRLHDQALLEGYKDEVCPEARCGVVLLAHHHFLRCDHAACPMVSRQNLNSDGNPKNLLETLIDIIPSQSSKPTEKENM